MYGIIYKATGPDGRVYIGQTVKTLVQRKCDHAFRAKVRDHRTSFQIALLELGGVNAFQWEQIDNAETKEELDTKEKYWIAYLDSTNPARGYNTCEGVKYTPSHETKSKISEACKGKQAGEKHPNAKNHRSDRTADKT